MTPPAPTSPVPEMTCLELKARLDEGPAPVLVDVREAHELAIADLPPHGQLHIPLGDFIQRMDEVDPAAEVVVYCRSGARSALAARHLLKRGQARVWNLKGGVLGWRADVDPSLEAY